MCARLVPADPLTLRLGELGPFGVSNVGGLSVRGVRRRWPDRSLQEGRDRCGVLDGFLIDSRSFLIVWGGSSQHGLNSQSLSRHAFSSPPRDIGPAQRGGGRARIRHESC